ncbi:MAG: hypothetical protein H8E55_32530 [Pelagibacterales bacterium]|nr:hypothetical protein [Pelagibacterales bacterium]
MENFNQIFTLLAESDGIRLNTDILETGLINIISLLGILIYVGRDFLGSTLEKRRNDILSGIQDAEERLNEANKRFNEAQKQATQANVIIAEIKNETLVIKKRLLETESNQSKKELAIRFSRALAAFRTKERQIFLNVKQQIVTLVLNQTLSKAKETFAVPKRATALISETIDKLEGDLL